VLSFSGAVSVSLSVSFSGVILLFVRLVFLLLRSDRHRSALHHHSFVWVFLSCSNLDLFGLVVVVSVVVTTVWMGYGVMLKWWSEVVVVPTKSSVKTVMWCYNLQDL
jgi:hypothetical protein